MRLTELRAIPSEGKDKLGKDDLWIAGAEVTSWKYKH